MKMFKHIAMFFEDLIRFSISSSIRKKKGKTKMSPSKKKMYVCRLVGWLEHQPL